MNKPVIAILIAIGWIAGLVATAFALFLIMAAVGGAASFLTTHV